MTATGQQRSFRLTQFAAPLQEMLEPTPVPTGTEVLLAVRACGVCHSDIHIAEGHFDLGGGQKMDLSKGIALPRTLGHEIAGTVVAAGPEAEGVAPGDERVVFPWIGCGTCSLCLRGEEHLCPQTQTLGTTRDGGFSTYVLVPHPRYLFDTSPLPLSFAATLACSGLTAYSALGKAGTVSEQDPVLIIGAGGVGLAAVSIARARFGVGPVVADIDPAKRAAALEAGASAALDPNDKDARKALLKSTGGGVAAVVDFVGAQATVEYGLSVVRKGGRVIVVGLFGGAVTLPIPTLPLRAISVAGSYVGSLAEMTELVALARTGALRPMPIETRPLDAVQATLDDLRAGRIRGRAVLVD
ncbi:alcohol dehydrogenase [Azospirillum sp.]|uniref:alcohol dehydrogenase n=1 Tax=Azospirillum sp. TaxID=34012 RepID=UPI002D56AC04|nr:alcohol dehydrogenase [Azospirillum sp.]HYD70085.1 alcohol dehydrogenase [Azospirillum sp.]